MSIRLVSGIVLCVPFVVSANLLADATEADSAVSAAERVAAMSADEKRELQNKWERFQNLDSAEQDRIRGLHAELQKSEDSERLTRVMESYNEWLKTLSASKRAELLQLPAAERLTEIRKLTRDSAERGFRRGAGRNIRGEDVRVIFEWLDKLVESREQQLLDSIPPHMSERINEIPDPRIRRMMMVRASVRERDGSLLAVLKPTPEEVGNLLSALPAEIRDEVRKDADQEEQTRRIEDWMRMAMSNRFPPPEVDPAELEAYFASLPADQRDMLERLPAEKMRYELRRQYFQERFGRWGPPGGPEGPFGSGRRFGPGPRGEGRDNPDGRRGPGGGGRGSSAGRGPRPERPRGEPDGFGQPPERQSRD